MLTDPPAFGIRGGERTGPPSGTSRAASLVKSPESRNLRGRPWKSASGVSAPRRPLPGEEYYIAVQVPELDLRLVTEFRLICCWVKGA